MTVRRSMYDLQSVVAATTGMIILASFVSPTQAVATTAAAGRTAPGVDTSVVSVPWRVVQPRGSRTGTGLPQIRPHPIHWPAATSVTVPVPASGASSRAGSLPITVRSAHKGSSGRVLLRTLPHQQATSLGGVGVAFTLADASAETQVTAGSATGVRSTVVTIDASGFSGASGGNLLPRLRVVALPACAATTPGRPSCRTRTPISSSADSTTGKVTATVPARTAPAQVFMLAAAATGDTGTYAASPLASSSRWAVTGGSGGFSWSYPIPVVPVPGNSQPSLSAEYSSQNVDGMVGSENSQPSWTGLGWELSVPFIERRYTTCADDTVASKPVPGYENSGDECWAGDYMELSLAGHSSPLVRDQAAGGDVWRPRDDPAWRVERFTGASNGDGNGEYWQVLTSEGIRYTFGKGAQATTGRATNSVFTVPVFGNNPSDPCHAATPSASWCQQAWRWNLDASVDSHGNEASYFYTKEQNSYARFGTTTAPYTRAGYVSDLEYGLRAGAEGTTAPARLHFTTLPRCSQVAGGGGSTCPALTSSSLQSDYPDVPADQICSASCTQAAPAFFTGVLLRSITSQRSSGTTWNDVDSVAFSYTYPQPTDGSTASLWLDSIVRTGKVGGSVAQPAVSFSGIELTNRVETGAAPLRKLRVSSVVDEMGRRVDVTYGRPDACVDGALPSPASNTQDCFPAWRTDGTTSAFGWWNKYLVTQIKVSDQTGGSPPQTTQYRYSGSPAWHYDDTPATPIEHQSWGDWRGYGRVDMVQLSDPALRGETTARPLSLTRSVYFRGMDGDRAAGDPMTGMGSRRFTVTDSTGITVNDDPWLVGRTRETQKFQLDSAGAPAYEISGGVTSYGVARLTSVTPGTADPKHDAHLVVPVQQANRQTVIADPGGIRTVRSATDSTQYDSYGQPVTVTSSAPGAATAGGGSDTRCTKTTYARDAATVNSYLLTYPYRVRAYAGTCASPTALIAGTDTYYDGSATLGGAITRGDPTRAVAAATASAPDTVNTSISSSTTYDADGRSVSSTDANGRSMSTAYTPATGIPISKTTTNALGQKATITLDPNRGTNLATQDANNQVTRLSYDPLGRLLTVRLPGTAAADPANTLYTYRLDPAKQLPPEITTRTLQSGSIYVSSYQFMDSLGQARQSQTVSPASTAGTPKTIINDTRYDDRGQVAASTLPVVANGTAGSALIAVSPSAASESRTTYDAVQRPTVQAFYATGVLKWQSTTAYFGDHARLTPPSGGAVTTSWTDVRGRTVHSEQGAGSSLVAMTFKFDDADRMIRSTDPAGHPGAFDYDLLGRLISTSDSDAGATSISYDAAGNPTSTTDAAGTQITTVYDAMNRPTSVWKGAANTGTRLSISVYDSATVANGIGRLVSQTTYATTDFGKAYTQAISGYDGRGQVLGKSWTIPAGVGLTLIPSTFKTSYAYDQAGHRTSVTYPDRVVGLDPETVTTSYDSLGYPTTLTGVQSPLIGGPATVPYVSATGYAADGKLLSRSYANPNYPLTRQYAYQSDTQRLSRVTTLAGDPFQPGTTAKQDDSYAWDPAGNLTSLTDNVPPLLPGDPPTSTCYTYDSLQRLSHAWTTKQAGCTDGSSTTTHDGPSGFNESWTYSADGNITSARSLLVNRTFSYNDANHPHAVTTAGADVFGYDANGQQNSRLKALVPGVLSYTPQRQLGSVTSGLLVTRFVNSADGSRLVRFNPDSTATVYLDGEEISIVKGIASGTRYYSQGGSVVAQRDQVGILTWQFNDQQGSAQSWVLSGTGIMKRTYYDPYGKIRDFSLKPATDHGFLGKVADPATGLDDLGARGYDPDLGRFISPDPLVDLSTAQSANAYSYGANNPVIFMDPSGLISIGFGGLSWAGEKFSQGLGAVSGFTLGVAKDAVKVPKALFDVGEGIVYVNTAYNPVSPTYWLEKWLRPDLQAQQQAQISGTVSAIADHPGLLWDAATADIRQDWNNGNKAQASGRAAFDIVTLLLGGGSLIKAAKAARATTAIDEVAAVADAAPAAADAAPAVTKAGVSAGAAGGGSKPFVMGIEDHLDEFAKVHGGETWKDLPESQLGGDEWKTGVTRMLSSPDKRVLFNLDGVDVWPGVSRGATGRGGATDWELLQIKSNDFPNLEFWRDGQLVGNPFS